MSVRPVCRPSLRPLRLAVADEPDLALDRRVGRLLDGHPVIGRHGGLLGRGDEERPRTPAEERRDEQRRERRDPRVVPIDLVVVELASVGDHPLEPLDLVLQVEHVVPASWSTGYCSTTANSERTAALVCSAWTACSGIGSVEE